MLDTQDINQPGPDIGLLDDWISRHDLAISLGVSEDTLWRWDAKHTGPLSIKLGRKVYYRRATVRSWLEAREDTRKTPARGRR
jgi:predicted DNA-binding transcriptional regulator AlpA